MTTDIDKSFEPDIVSDILTIELPININYDILWASPPCESFSVASIGKHWNIDHTPKTKEAEHGMSLLQKTITIIEILQPKYWFIENPRGKMRKVIEPLLDSLPHKRETVCYCRYGDTRMKPTDIWTNCLEWKPINRMCHNGNTDHESAPRGARTGTQGIKGYKERSKIPSALFSDIFNQIYGPATDQFRGTRPHHGQSGSGVYQ